MNIAMASLVILLLASGGVWSCYFLGTLPCPPSEEDSPREKPRFSLPALALVIFLVVSSLLAKRSQVVQLEQLQSRSVEGIVVWGLLLGALLIVPGMSLREYGFRFRDLPRQLAVGGLAFLASLLPVYVVLLATSPLRSPETLHPFLQLLQTDPGAKSVFWIGLSVVLVAPMLEELIYRVILQSAFEHWLPATVAVLLTAVVFSLVHGWPDMIPLFPLALILGWVYHHYRSYLAVVTTHALFNGWMLVWALVIPSGG